ncbi:MAG: PilC/PilY family type IV pilus protein [Gammaproteobacteria bacterium]|nr:PilC/PilY family type IV pilus protein [Gammaproteobacteria bacterium]
MHRFTFRLKTLAGLIALLLASQLQAADAFDPSLQPLGSVSPLTLSNTDISGGAMAYRAWFENGSWQGDIVEYTISNLGALTTSVDLTGHSPANTGSPPANWSANVKFDLNQAANSSYWDTGREIVTWDGSDQKAFRWANLSDAQKEALDKAVFDASGSSSDILNFVRGERTNEPGLRYRQSILGDIIHSNPVYVGPPEGTFTYNGYAAFASTYAARDERVYVGANDGMLHALDADDGNEVWAYIPSILIGDLDLLAGRPYTHQYFVDGSLTSRDVYFSSAWHTVLVGGLGAGGKAWFGLDITNDSLSDETATSGTDLKVLWEIDANSDDDLGYSYGQAVIAKANDGATYAVLGNGYNSANGIAVLYLVNIGTGGVTRLSTGSGSAGSPNGLSAPSLVDFDANGTVDFVYAGDIDGNMWKFDLTSTSAGSWAVAYSGTPVHPGVATQPIIQSPDVTRHPVAGHLVLFGTGRLFTEADMADTSVQAIYGIWDSGATPPDIDSQVLLAQTLSGDQTYTATDITETVQTFDPDPGFINWATHDGWMVELPAGFRALQPPQLRGGRLKITINEPNTRANYVLETYYVDGGAPGSAVFDLDKSDTLTLTDNIDSNSDGDLVDSVDIVVMWAQPAGVMSQATIARVADGVDAQLFNYVVPPVELPCAVDCPDGFQGGHIDVDTDYFDNTDGGVGDKTFKHTHVYDKKVGRVFLDYQDLDNFAVTGNALGHAELDETWVMDAADEFIVVVANADLSPGAVLTLDDREYNVVEYQAMIHKKLRAWNGSGPLEDDDGNSLIFTTAGLAADGGTVKNAFDDMAILAGGLHPSNTGCVNRDDAVTNNRYRNGALVTQAINRDIFIGGSGNALDALIVQLPTDLLSPVVLGNGDQVALKEDFDGSGSFDTGSPDYEVFGGLRADISGQGDDDAYWESTVFWHYGGASCYGEPNWEADVAQVVDEAVLTQEEFDEILAALGITDLQAALDSLEYCKDTKEKEGGCKDTYSDLQDLEHLESTIWSGAIASTTGLESDGETPVVMEGTVAQAGLTVGPNFESGRRTWTDITAD